MEFERKLVGGHWCQMPISPIDPEKIEFTRIDGDEAFRKIIDKLRKISTMTTEADRIQWHYKHLNIPINNNPNGQTLMAEVATYEDTPVGFTSMQGAHNHYGCKGLLTYVHPAFRGMKISMRCYERLWTNAWKDFGVGEYPEMQIGHNIDQFKKNGFKALTAGRPRKDGRMTQTVFLIGYNHINH